MINRGDIKLAIDMVVNAQDDNLFGGEAEYVINTLEDCGNTIAAQAAVIAALRAHLKVIAGLQLCADNLMSNSDIAAKALAIPTNSTQILDEVRRAERERVAQMILNGRFLHDESPAAQFAKEVATAIRAME